MTTVWGCSARSTPRRGSADRFRSWLSTKPSDRVRLMKPGPLTSTTAQTPPTETAAATSSAMSRGGRPTCLARARAPLAWKSARSDGRRVGSAPGTMVSKAAWSFSRRTRARSGIPHCRMAARTALRRAGRLAQSAGAPMAPSVSP